MSRPCEGRKRTRFTQNMNVCRATANSVHTSPYRGRNRCYRGLNEALPRFKRGATAVNASDERGSASFKTQTHYTLSLVYTVRVYMHTCMCIHACAYMHVHTMHNEMYMHRMHNLKIHMYMYSTCTCTIRQKCALVY